VEDKMNIPLTAAELSALWTQYMNDSVATCVNRYFLVKVEDEEVRPIIEWTLDTAKENISIMQEIFKKENFPIPIGFTDQDVNVKAQKLFSDTFKLSYLQHMSIIAIGAGGSALGLATREDVVIFFKRILEKAVHLQDLTRDLMLKQGTYVKSPVLTLPEKIEFVETQHYLAGFFGKKRALTSIEVTHLFYNIQTNTIGKALITGFAQTAESKDIKDYLARGIEIAQKHIDIFGAFLHNEDLPIPMTWDATVSDSTEQIFSDKLLMFHVMAMIASGVGFYGAATAASPRRDLGFKYATLIPEILLYLEDGANLMIKHGWLEEPPQANDRDDLIKK
jgi:hypothetical protein